MSINNVTEVKNGNGYWKLNNSILSDKLFCIKFREWCIEFSDGLDICIDVWDYFKENIKTFCIDYCKKKNRIKHAVIKDLEKRYFRLCKLESKSPGNYYEQISVLKDEIKQYYLNDFRGSQIRGKAKLLDNSERVTKFFFQREVHLIFFHHFEYTI